MGGWGDREQKFPYLISLNFLMFLLCLFRGFFSPSPTRPISPSVFLRLSRYYYWVYIQKNPCYTSTNSLFISTGKASLMKLVRDIMTTDVVSISPANKIKTAIILMKNHHVGGLPVLDSDRPVGVIEYRDIIGKDSDIQIQSIMERDFVTIPPQISVTDAADLMTKIGAGRLLVVEGGVLSGVVTIKDILPELGRSVDTLTGLARADAMRDWGIAALKRGMEITVIFIDLDDFGKFNKEYGHVVGDLVLKHVSKVLQENVDEDKDLLCRYAGDEFVIVTTRHANEASELAALLSDQIQFEENPELPEPVTGTIGVYGGKRTKEREDVHFAATLDNLINLASKACTAAKKPHAEPEYIYEEDLPEIPEAVASTGEDAGVIEGDVEYESPVGLIDKEDTAAEAIEEIPEDEFITELSEEEIARLEAEEAARSASRARVEEVPDEPAAEVAEEVVDEPAAEVAGESAPRKRLRINALNFSWDGSSAATAEVELVSGGKSKKRSRSGMAMGSNALRLVVEATADAVCEFLPSQDYGVVTESVNIVRSGTEDNVVLVTALFVTPKAQMRMAGSCLVRQDAYRAAASALLDAINRQMESLL